MLFRRDLRLLLPATLVAALVLTAVLIGPAFAAKPDEVRSEDGYVLHQNLPGGDHQWKLGANAVEKTIELRGGSLVLSSFIGRQADPKAPMQGLAGVKPHEYLQGKASCQFAVTINGKLLLAIDGGYSLKDSSAKKLSQGELQLDIVLAKQPLQVTKHYVVYPRTGIIREWTSFKNISKKSFKLSNPDFLSAHLMSEDIKNGLSFGWFTGGAAGETQRLVIEKVDATYSRTFATFGSAGHLPLMILSDDNNRRGITMGWDYLGPWAAPLGNVSGKSFQMGLRLDKFSRLLKPGDVLDTPKAFHGVFAGDFDDMGNLNLDWQYRYMWQHKKADYFARPRYATDFDGPYWTRCGTEELWSRRLAMDLYFMDLARYAGAGILWNDAAWYDEFGNWNGPDWSQTNKYTAKQGMKMLIWVWSAVGFPDCKAERDLGPLLTELKVGPLYLNQSEPAATNWQLNLLNDKVRRWGDFQWRYDYAPALGPDRLAADQEFRRLNREFLAKHPGCAIDSCMGGGNGIGYDLASYAQSQQISDGGVYDYSAYHLSMIIPPDMLYDCFNILGHNGRKAYDERIDRIHLRMLPGWIADPGCKEPYQSKNTDSHYRPGVTAIRTDNIAALESIRRDWDLHNYFLSQKVIGRWSHVFRPEVKGDEAFLYFQRMNQAGDKGFIVTQRPVGKADSLPAGPITIMPKGLMSNLNYDIRFDLSSGNQNRTGADLMQNGIQIDALKPGEIIYFNLPNYPGSGTDKTPPTAPTNVTQRVGTNVFTQGKEITWKPARDNNWLSSYEVFKITPDGKETSLGKVSVGTYFFDRSAVVPDLARCRYFVQAIDGDGNASAKVEAKVVTGEPETHYGFGGYGPEQGWRGWSYAVTSDNRYYQPLLWFPTHGFEGLWKDDLQCCIIGRTTMSPDPGRNLARIFTVKREGKVTLKGTIKKDQTMGVIMSNDCAVRILKNDQQIWPQKGWQHVPADGTPVNYNVRISVKLGDRIIHMLRGNRNNVSGDIAWNPIILY